MVLNAIKGACVLSVCTSLAACAESVPRPRIAFVGSAGEQGDGAQTGLATGATTRLGTASGSTAKFVVTAGNMLIGAAGASLSVSLDGAVPSTGVLAGAVTGILQTTGHTLVELSNGASVLLNGTGGKVGDLLSVDLASGKVIAGPRALVGSNALAANPVSRQPVTASGGGGTNVVGTARATASSGSGAVGTARATVSSGSGAVGAGAAPLGSATPGSTAGSIGSTVTKTVGTPTLRCC